MSEKDDLKRLVRIVVFILAFVVTGLASIGILGIAMGIATKGVGSLMGGVLTSVNAVSEVVTLFPKIFEISAQEEMARQAEEAAKLAAEEEIAKQAEEIAKQTAEKAAKRAAEEAAELIMKELGDFALEETSDAATKEELELKIAAEKWIKENKAAANTGNFIFEASVDTDPLLTITSKVKISGCPAKSVWILWSEGCEWGNSIPKNKNCKSITPKVITDYKGSGDC